MPLELKCRVIGNDSFTIQWHNSNIQPSVDSSSSQDTVIDSTSVNVSNVSISNDSWHFDLVSILTLDYEMAAGYYWCAVSIDSMTLNPSQVLHVSTCPFNNDEKIDDMSECKMKIDLVDTQNCRCANGPASIDLENEQLGSMDMCPIIHGSDPSARHTHEESTTTDRASFNLDLSTISPYVWIVVGITFALLVTIIIIMLSAIVYLNHKKNKIRGTAIYYTTC